jgi:hypothetical protein
MSPVAEVHLFAAARAQLVHEVIRPALDAGRWVVSDRFLDTRDDVQFFYERPGPYPFGHVLQFYLLQGNCGVPVGAKGAILNVTITAPTVDGHLALFTPPSDGTTQSVVPTTSLLNFKAGQTVANGTIVRLSPYFSPANADLGIYPHVPGGEVHVILDVVGYLQ